MNLNEFIPQPLNRLLLSWVDHTSVGTLSETDDVIYLLNHNLHLRCSWLSLFETVLPTRGRRLPVSWILSSDTAGCTKTENVSEDRFKTALFLYASRRELVTLAEVHQETWPTSSILFRPGAICSSDLFPPADGVDMKLGMLLVVSVAVLLPSRSEGRTVSECELKEKLGEAITLPGRLQRFKEKILAIGEVYPLKTHDKLCLKWLLIFMLNDCKVTTKRHRHDSKSDRRKLEETF